MALLPPTKRPDVVALAVGAACVILLMAFDFPMHVCACVFISFASFSACFSLVPAVRPMFIKAGLSGSDLNKNPKSSLGNEKIAESLGLVCACVYLIAMFIYIPFHFTSFLLKNPDAEDFPHHKFVEFMSGLLSICCMALLGFADDVLNLAWRHKLWLPTIATLPLLLVYYVNLGSTTLIVPVPLRHWFGYSIELGVLFYMYQGMLAVFCTNAINIYAGINGIEAGQSLVIAATLVLHNLFQIVFADHSEGHQLSFWMLLPFVAVNAALLFHNWYPSNVFVGDTFCYFAGMTFAVAAILGGFSRTLLLLFIPQTINFILSVPQLFKIVPCPRHRLPKYNASSGLLEPSVAFIAQKEETTASRLCIWLFSTLGLVTVQETDNGRFVSNFTLINAALCLLGPTHERKLATYLLILQVLCSMLAMVIRYGVASYFEMLVAHP